MRVISLFRRGISSGVRFLRRNPGLHTAAGEYPSPLSDGHPVVLEDAYGIRFVLYPWDRRPIDTLLSREFYRSEFKGIGKLLRPGDTVFDVGASIGLHSVFMSRLITPSGSLYAFEPVPDTYWMLRETLALNRCGNVVPLQLAVSDKVGAVTMNLFELQYCDYNTMGCPVMPGLDGQPVRPSTSTLVESQTLDNFCLQEGIDRVDFLKVDVEGFEKHVLTGSQGLLAHERIGLISFEISEDPLKGAGVVAQEVFQLLESYGYRSYRFNELSEAFEGPIRDSKEYYQVYFASKSDLSQSGRDETGGGFKRE